MSLEGAVIGGFLAVFLKVNSSINTFTDVISALKRNIIRLPAILKVNKL